jgi:hypothetical protein
VQHARIPLPARLDVGESAIVEFVEDVEGQLQVATPWRGVDDGGVDGDEAATRRAALQVRDEGSGERSGRGRQVGLEIRGW